MQWHETPMQQLGNDHWRGTFQVHDLGRYLYTVTAWVDHFASWRHDLIRRTEPDDIDVALMLGQN